MDEISTRQLYKAHYLRVATYILRNSGTEEEAKDAFQEAWAAMLVRQRAGLHIQDQGDYLLRCAKNFYLRECRRKSTIIALDWADAADDDSEGETEGSAPTGVAMADRADESGVNEEPAPPPALSIPYAYNDQSSTLPDLHHWGIVGEALLLLSQLHQHILHLSLGLKWDNAAIAAAIGGYTEGAMAVEKSRAYNALRRVVAELKHQQGDSFFKKIEARKAAQKAARKARGDTSAHQSE